jgi:hypothetical protein
VTRRDRRALSHFRGLATRVSAARGMHDERRVNSHRLVQTKSSSSFRALAFAWGLAAFTFTAMALLMAHAH